MSATLMPNRAAAWRLILICSCGSAGDAPDLGGDLPGDAPRLGEVVAEDLDDDLRVRAGDLVVDAVDHRLGEAEVHAGQPGRERPAHALDQRQLVAAPFRVG